MAVDLNKAILLEFSAGLVAIYPGSSAPTGWVLCDGTSYDGTTSTYLALWGVVGTTFGGTGQSSFKVPDFRDRIALGKTGANSIGGTSKGVTSGPSPTSTGNQSVDHYHNATNTSWWSSDHYHYANKSGNIATNSGGRSADHGHGYTTGGISANHTHNQDHTHPTPDLVLNYIIKL